MVERGGTGLFCLSLAFALDLKPGDTFPGGSTRRQCVSIVLLLMASPQYGNAHMVPSYKRHFVRPTAYPPLVQGAQ